MLAQLQEQDPDALQITAHSRFVVAYELQQDCPNPGWRKANIEGPVYIVLRRTAPRFQLMVKNHLHMTNLVDGLHPDWELDCQKNYIFYKVPDLSKRIRGLWFPDDSERQKMEASIEATLQEIRVAPDEPQIEPVPVLVPVPPQPKAAVPEPVPQPAAAAMPHRGAPVAQQAQDSVAVTANSMRGAIHSLADDDAFLKAVMQKLKEFSVK
mmetsp:Transcript_74907/g.167822  ORF Transcript_74907/g.167822 Transcript_74907/m.167822 type:complete len:210 (-) Transcript_74907:138-767(-)